MTARDDLTDETADRTDETTDISGASFKTRFFDPAKLCVSSQPSRKPGFETGSGDMIDTEAAPPLIEGVHLVVTNKQSHLSPDAEFLTHVTETLLIDEGIEHAEISVALVDDTEIHAINRQYLDHDFPTDVISFLLSEDETLDSVERGRRIDGEIVISGETAVRSASEFGCSPREELALYLVHGLLHLCGYDDQNKTDRESMRAREQMHLQKFGIEPHY